ncbi:MULTISPECIES: transposase [Actinosynnema]|uniref:transposase n=1 Tax=Actinosynnema sp. NPDC000082 TaxID=3363910 RepID=UPI0035573DDD
MWAGWFVAPDAWVVDDTAFPKDGDASPGAARMYCGALGKTVKLPGRGERARGDRLDVGDAA